MKNWSVNELREMYLSFFESKGHLRLKSFSLVPKNDKSLLLINSGMAPMKAYFKGLETPPRNRVCTCQKCIRTGDIENIGHTARHGTFFEMLGNFSFGDYFKKEAITWCWEFLTITLGLDKNRLYPSVYKDDEEAYNLWHDYIGVPSERIVKLGKEDNFWEHGSGPCGPCSEVYYDRGEKYGCKNEGCFVGCDCDRFMEIWNNVFTQFDNDGKGNYTELVQKNIDTGMGLERLAVVCQDVESIYEIDTNRELMDNISVITGHVYKDNQKDDISLRIIADHIKSCTFMISDGIMPSNEGRGYVLRRLLRRAIRHARLLGVKKPFMQDLAKVVIKLNMAHYVELVEHQDMILNVLKSEEEKFNNTIDQGLQIFNDIVKNLKKGDRMEGDDAFKLYDTYGFPLDLTKELLEEKEMGLDEEKFNELMKEQKHKARSARKVSNYMGADATIYNELDKNMTSEFVGYSSLKGNGIIKAIITNDKISNVIEDGEEGVIITDKTNFYPLMGGQEGDIGTISTSKGEFAVYDTIKIQNTKIGHIGKVVNGSFNLNDEVEFNVDYENRHRTAINHTSTHLLHAALRKVLGTHVEQAGSSVACDRLRFDFTHFSAMTTSQINEVEQLVNDKINECLNVVKTEMGLEEAKNKGAMALFGEKYGDVVRTIKIDDFSFELCGGTHIDNTNEIKYFKIISETAVAAGVRRIEAITHNKVVEYLLNEEKILKQVSGDLKSTEQDVPNKIVQLQNEIKELTRANEQLKKMISNQNVSQIEAEKVGEMNVVIKDFDDKTSNELKDIEGSIKDKYENYAIVLLGKNENGVDLVVSMSDYAIKNGLHAGNILKQISETLGGKGGGRDKFAEGKGKDISKINDAMKLADDMIKSSVK